ncbi:alpha/beta hydrolase [Fulvivirga sp. RKSG066]|uniref:alpha/beta fold hydrolase n=1 Tax=Fulvivirga aurantia TaxID=2529383 RepID=UPI0012BD03B7|nr:alpha/beta hydrolase [Fulvivirga aurantia]MTI21000.1 alpha/beta hydrolase [Fulvivirga aurantia]
MEKSAVIKRNNVSVLGEGTQTMVFAHGFGCDQNVWRYVTPAFEKDYKIILFDYVGAGKSDLKAYDKERYDSLEGYAQDVIEICEAFDLEDVIFVGHSVSSMIGLLAAKEKPNLFNSLIFIGPSPRYINDTDYIGGFERKDIEDLLDVMDNNYLGWSKNMAPVIMGNPERPELGEELTNNFCATDPEIARQFARVTFLSDNRKDLPLISLPSLTLQCSEDIIAPKEVGEYVAKVMPNNTMMVMNATGHCPHMSAPEETIEMIKEYLNSTKVAS